MKIKLKAWMINEQEMWAMESLMLMQYHKPSDNIFNDESMVLLQSTGKTDTNDVEAYEGDIIKSEDDVLTIIHSVTQVMFDDKTRQAFKNFEILGNMYENPELLRL